MRVEIYSREAIEELIEISVLRNTAVISFYDPITKKNSDDYSPVNYKGK